MPGSPNSPITGVGPVSPVNNNGPMVQNTNQMPVTPMPPQYSPMPNMNQQPPMGSTGSNTVVWIIVGVIVAILLLSGMIGVYFYLNNQKSSDNTNNTAVTNTNTPTPKPTATTLPSVFPTSTFDDTTGGSGSGSGSDGTVTGSATHADYNLYTNSTYHFSMEYPKNWERKDNYSSTIVAFVKPNTGVSINVVSEPLPSSNYTAKDFSDAAVKGIQTTYPGVNVKIENTTLDGSPAIKLTYSPAGIYIIQYLVIKSSSAYVLTEGGPTSTDTDKYSAEFKIMTDSFHVK